MNENNWNIKNLHYDLMLLRFTARYCCFVPSVIINKITLLLLRWKLCFDMYASLICLILCGTNKILRAIVLLLWSNFFQSFECDGKYIPLQLCLWIKGSIFDILWGLFSMFWWFNAIVKAYWKQLSSLSFLFIVALYFSTIQENLYMIHSFSNLRFEGGNTINQYYQKQTCYLSMVLLNFFDNIVK